MQQYWCWSDPPLLFRRFIREKSSCHSKHAWIDPRSSIQCDARKQLAMFPPSTRFFHTAHIASFQQTQQSMPCSQCQSVQAL